jgi:hypothetical protein
MESKQMDKLTIFPDPPISDSGPISKNFMALQIKTFQDACRYVHELPYGYNSDKDDPMLLFAENMGTCTTKHAVIATLAAELNLPIEKHIGVYAMTEEIVTGATAILAEFELPYVPLVHCFLVYKDCRVDLTEGNRNGKNRSIQEFLFTAPVVPNISAKDEYRLYRGALKDLIASRPELNGIDIASILRAREKGLALLKANIEKR